MRVCSSCGGSNISGLVWVDRNDGSVIEAATDDVKCWDCNEVTGEMDAYQYELLHPKQGADSSWAPGDER
jgi:NMD protein affecting ribosome stability and mRNA decay